jgi:hypothetical protein
MGAVIFSDMLGFSAYVAEDFRAAVELHEMFQMNMTFLVREESIHPVASYPEPLREFASDSSLTAFDSVLPMSDSIFLISADGNLAAVQWSHFLITLLRSTANLYRHVSGVADPRVAVETHIHLQPDGTVGTSARKRLLYPLLLKSGISGGHFSLLDTKGLLEHKIVTHTNIAGIGVVAAAGLAERDRRGAFFLSDETAYETFGPDLKDRCVPEPTSAYEILWPSYYFIDNNIHDYESLRTELINYDLNLLDPIAELFLYFDSIKSSKVASHYKRILLLLGKSFLHYCQLRGIGSAGTSAFADLLGRRYSFAAGWDFLAYPNESPPNSH